MITVTIQTVDDAVLAAGGERGVDRVLAWLRDDIHRTMSLLGTTKIADLDRSLLDAGKPDE